MAYTIIPSSVLLGKRDSTCKQQLLPCCCMHIHMYPWHGYMNFMITVCLCMDTECVCARIQPYKMDPCM